MSDTVLSVRDLNVHFYTNRRCNKTLRGVSFDIRRGKILCIVGESGCGKSVTANSVMGLLPDLSRIESGRIDYFDGERTVRIDRLERKGKEMQSLRGKEISMIFQDPMTALNPVFTIGFQIGETLLRHGKARDRRDAAAQSVKLLESMACEPGLLIADEPTTALDVTIQAQIFELMLSLRENNGTAIMLITHDMGVVAELADDVAVMYMGNIVESGAAVNVLNRPAHPYTQALLRSIPVLGKGKSQALTPIRGSTPDPYNRPAGCQFRPRCDFATARCDTEMPPEEPVGENHRCRCFHNLYTGKGE